MTEQGMLPRGERLRRAVKWLSEQERKDLKTVEEACRRFDLSPLEEDFLLKYFLDRGQDEISP
ncbi:MAG: hypothetical protein SVU69_02135 [Pseudomonadota bacterium]|nr:hypothetical protein [Pseudomonadota bacterium]